MSHLSLSDRQSISTPNLRLADDFIDEAPKAAGHFIRDESQAEEGKRLCDTPLFQHYAEALLGGDRPTCRRVVEQAAEAGVDPRRLLLELCWPAMESIRELYKENKISLAAEHMATRLNRATVDRITGELAMMGPNGRKVMVLCGDAQGEELGGQITADLFESEGYEVKFLGGGIPTDEANHLVGLWRPDVIVLFATLPAEMPAARALIDKLREHGNASDMQVMCCGGIYKRAQGLGEEVGADLVAFDAADAVRVAEEYQGHKASAMQQTVGRSRRERVTKEKKATRARAAEARRARKAA
jgi:methanogenic corrinoid protein MtbC1